MILTCRKWHSRCRGVEKVKISVPMLHEKHTFFRFPCSMGVPKLLFATPPERECQFCSPGTNALTSNHQRTHLQSGPLGVKTLHMCKRKDPIWKTFLSNEREGRCNTNSFLPIWLDVDESNIAQRFLCVYLYLKHWLSTIMSDQNAVDRTRKIIRRQRLCTRCQQN